MEKKYRAGGGEKHCNIHSLVAPDPKKNRVWESPYIFFWWYRNLCSTNQISPRQINDVTLVIDTVSVTIIACQIIFLL